MTDMTTKRKAAALLAVAIAAPAEGLRQWAYNCPAGIVTVCYGHTGTDVRKDREYSIAECRALLQGDMAKAIDQVDNCMPGLPPKVLAAFGDAVFNIGPTVACDPKNSTAARLLAAGQWRAACDQLPRWNKARVAGLQVELPGLTKRRAQEQALCLQGATP